MLHLLEMPPLTDTHFEKVGKAFLKFSLDAPQFYWQSPIGNANLSFSCFLSHIPNMFGQNLHVERRFGVKPVFHWKTLSCWLPNANGIDTNNMKPSIPNTNYIPWDCVAARVGSTRPFGYQHVGICKAKKSR